MTELTVRGIRTRMLRGGAGPRVLFLHGAAGLSGWSEFFQLLASRYEIWFPEHPGFGLTEESSAITNITELAGYYRHFIEGTGVGPCHVIGSSFGGWLAAELATLEDVALRSLTLIGPAGLRARVAGARPATEEAFVRKLYYDQTVADRVLATPMDEEQRRLQTVNRNAAARLGGSFHNPDLEPALTTINAPALVLWGDQDQLVPADQAPLWHGCLRRSELTVFANCGHLPHFEQPATVDRRIQDFLAMHS
ncbi:alpha/beta fold hydrolase (plasmid) [Cupriavidus sp. KK10]|jgi:pimeloyl-ACP methyl ester carboxylesterase|uniref:alpha/beta fold hydrolase n=1 Tax=Cupriavidus sp. KK10 TaxID=1478019 RepID=UPI001BAB46BB|nr:alpha/beta fold hydrolase [Cupriavidus sp. KK10]QUN32555.1 alpha/beta fold hydrolase [Cupriavidus sp. KK10]